MEERNSIDFWIDTNQSFPRRKRVHGEIGSQRTRTRRSDDGSSAPLLRPVYDLSRLRSTSNSSLTRINDNNENQPLNRSELRRNGDRFQPTTVPNDLELAGGSGPVLQPLPTASSSPGYWNQYGGQESGVKTLL